MDGCKQTKTRAICHHTRMRIAINMADS